MIELESNLNSSDINSQILKVSQIERNFNAKEA
jgi:hypothetical protein